MSESTEIPWQELMERRHPYDGPKCACGETEQNTLSDCARCRAYVCEECRIYSERDDVFVCDLCVVEGDRNPQGAGEDE